MIFVHRTSIVNFTQECSVDVKAACKAVAPAFIRRTDRFIQLGLLGCAGIVDDTPLESNTALYMASGQGNLSVFNRICAQHYVEHLPPKPVDFINSLSNTSGFYIAKFLGLNSKNLNLAQHGFVAENTLLLACNDLIVNREQQVLVGGVDERLTPQDFTKKFLGLPDEQPLGEGSNWMLLSTAQAHAVASIEVNPHVMNFDEIVDYLKQYQGDEQLAFGYRCPAAERAALLASGKQRRFEYESQCGFYETLPFYVMNLFIETQQGVMIFIDYFEQAYRIITIKTT